MSGDHSGVRRVLRCDLPHGRELIEVETRTGSVLTVYVSRTGAAIRVFKRTKEGPNHELVVKP